MILFNGLKFAKNDNEVIDSLFQGTSTAHGKYKVRRGRKSGRVAIEFFTLQGEPMALISPDAALVTAHRTEDGKTRYMYGMTEQTKNWLGMQDTSYRDESQMAFDVLASVILAS